MFEKTTATSAIAGTTCWLMSSVAGRRCRKLLRQPRGYRRRTPATPSSNRSSKRPGPQSEAIGLHRRARLVHPSALNHPEATVALTLSSSSFKEGETLKMDNILSADYGFGCGGGNKSPQLSWSGAAAGGTRSAATP